MTTRIRPMSRQGTRVLRESSDAAFEGRRRGQPFRDVLWIVVWFGVACLLAILALVWIFAW